MEIRQQSGVYMKQPLMKLATMLRISRWSFKHAKITDEKEHGEFHLNFNEWSCKTTIRKEGAT